MAEYQITHIYKPGGSESTTDHITHVWIANYQYFDTDGQIKTGSWFTVETVINYLKSGNTFFYTHPSSAPRAYITYQAIRLGGREYIKTQADQTTRDNLLSLPNEANK